MNFESFLRERSEVGIFDSEGQFTVDLRKASDKVAAFALPSENHCLLKVVQVAHRFRAEEIRVIIGRSRTWIEFRPSGVQTFELERLYAAVADPLGIEDPLLKDLVAALYGTLGGNHHSETLWEHHLGDFCQRLVIAKNRRVFCERVEIELEDEPDRAKFRFSVAFSDSWKFWKGARRRIEAAALLRQHCQYSAAKLFVDGSEQEVKRAADINQHVSRNIYEPGENDLFNKLSEPASNILFELASEDSPAFGLARPSLSVYLVRREVMNVWAQGMRVRNSLKPDGQSSAAWMLQFRRDGQNISMRWARKRDRYSAVLGLNVANAGSHLNPRVTIVRSGVTLLEREFTDEEMVNAYRGCHLIVADETLSTDLSGFQLVEDETFRKTLLSYAGRVEEARSYFAVGKEMMNIPESASALIDGLAF